jgi:hypothetical protein
MTALLRSLCAMVVVSACTVAARSDDKELAENPYYKYWSKSKVGSSVELKETTRSPAVNKGKEAEEDVKLISHKLIELTAEKALVETVVTEGEIFGFVQSAPTKHIYPAKMNKDLLEDLLKETGAKGTESTVKVGDKELKAKLITGTSKKGDEEVECKIWLTDEVPGGITKRMRTTKIKGEVVAETTTEVVSYKKN